MTDAKDQEAKETTTHLPFTEIVKAIPGFFGIRLEDQPEYEVLKKEGHIEVRKYQPLLVAETVVHGEHEKALDEGFHKLAAYIFGENHSKSKLSMTNPVYQSKENEAKKAAQDAGSEQMSMTSPVFQSKESEGWKISFYLSPTYTLENAPKPNDNSVKLHQWKGRTAIAYSYSGNNSEEKMKEAEAEIEAWMSKNPSYRPMAKVCWAQYDAPFTIPFLKRNEALLEVKERSEAESH